MKKVLDNFLSQKHYQELIEYLQGTEWNYNSLIVYDQEDDPNQYQFVKGVWRDGLIYDRFIVDLFSYYLLPSAWVKIKANFSPKRHKLIENELHVDSNYGDMTGIFYINTNDGYTRFRDGSRIESIANRMVIFPRETLHSGTTSTTDHRFVINFNWFGVHESN